MQGLAGFQPKENLVGELLSGVGERKKRLDLRHEIV